MLDSETEQLQPQKGSEDNDAEADFAVVEETPKNIGADIVADDGVVLCTLNPLALCTSNSKFSWGIQKQHFAALGTGLIHGVAGVKPSHQHNETPDLMFCCISQLLFYILMRLCQSSRAWSDTGRAPSSGNTFA